MWGGIELGTYPSNSGGQLSWFRSNYLYNPLLSTKTRIQAQILNNIYTNSISNQSITCNKITNSEIFGSLYLFAIHDDTSENNVLITGSNIKIYNFKAYKNSEIIQNLIPCYCTTTVTDVNNQQCPKETIGLFDIVEGKFYTNQGTGTFNIGNNISSN